jgi:actin-like protein 6A
MKDGTFIDWDIVDNIWNHAFRQRLLINPEEHPMLIVEPSTNTGQQREKYVHIYSVFKLIVLLTCIEKHRV